MQRFPDDKLALLRQALADGMTTQEIRSMFGLSERTAYRWLDELRARGLSIVKQKDKTSEWRWRATT